MTRERWDAKEWRHALSSLRTLCDPGQKVYVRRVMMSDGYYGDCEKKRGHFNIRLSKAMNFHESLLVLIHEWAHAMSWDLQNRRDPHHDEHWGVCYSRCYRAVFVENQ